MAIEEMGRECDPDPHRYGEDDSRPFSLNWVHYREAYKAITHFFREYSTDPPRDGNQEDAAEFVPIELLQIPEQNRLLPIDGYFSFFPDLLGFSNEVSLGGMDSLPDYYGAAFAAAGRAEKVKVFLLSDSCIAFAPVGEADDFIDFVSTAVSNWLADGLLPQCVIGYGSFVERRPFADKQPPNFFGTQITGTALPDTVKFLKANKPSGSRILLTATARSHWPLEHQGRIVPDGKGEHEFIPQRTHNQYLFDCVYYLLCLREHDLDTPAFNHYVWSFASRAVGGEAGIPKLAVELAAPHYNDCKGIGLQEVISRIDEVLNLYQLAAPHG